MSTADKLTDLFERFLELVIHNDSRSVLEFIKENLPDGDLINRTDKNGRVS